MTEERDFVKDLEFTMTEILQSEVRGLKNSKD
jgi:hypothetical protein